MTTFKLAIICGGPSLERGISLNSARSVMDHLWHLDIQIFYVSPSLKYYALSPNQLYSNTPEDFDFKIHETATYYSQDALVKKLKVYDIVLPLIHGEYGEDGQLQAFLEAHQIPYVGSSAQACRAMFFKDIAQNTLDSIGYPTLAMCDPIKDDMRAFLSTHKKAVIKPQAGGSSIGVSIIETLSELEHALKMIPSGKAICEAYCSGIEFTVMVVDSGKGPVALIPTEVEIPEGIYDYRRKYLPTSNTRWHCPPRLSQSLIQDITQQAEAIFKVFGMRDFARLDGWVYQNKIIFSDLNPISGMEQNSFMFLQASRLGMTHQDILLYILKISCNRYGITPPMSPVQSNRSRIPVIMGGSSEERQVSLMSGTNVWLKLKQSKYVEPEPYFQDFENKLWPLPYTFALHHTCEEVYEYLNSIGEVREAMSQHVASVRKRLALSTMDIHEIYPDLEACTVMAFCQTKWSYIFLALHGGYGEDGRMQSILEQHQLSFNGSCSRVSKLAMDKILFGDAVNHLNIPNISSLKKVEINPLTKFSDVSLSLPYIIKPRELGCSVGITVVNSEHDFDHAVACMQSGVQYLAEAFIKTDHFKIKEGTLEHISVSGWVELTIVVTESQGVYSAMIPSITVAKDAVLSMEEKFQGGTGINITPPACIEGSAINSIMAQMEVLSKGIGLRDYVRFDLFYHIANREIIIIEMNSLPALTPSTVLYQQMLATGYAQSPTEILEKIGGLANE